MGRPSDYTQEIADRICDLVATTPKGIRRICEENEGLPDPDTIYRWLRKNQGFYEQYARAKQAQLQAIEDEMIEIADDGRNDWMTIQQGGQSIKVVNREVVQRSQLRLDTRKWLMSKLLPKKYGEKLDMNFTGDLSLSQRLAKARSKVSNT